MSVFALGFFARPLGAWLMGVYADRAGRRTALTVSVGMMCLGALVIANTAWTTTFLRSISEDLVGVRTGISTSIYQLGGAIGAAATSGLMAVLGMADYKRQLQAAGIAPGQMEAALAALNTLLDPATADSAPVDPAVAGHLLAGYEMMHQAPTVAHGEVVEFVRDSGLHGRGIGWIDAHLLASALVGRLKLWTTDPRLMMVAGELGIAYE